ncbi:MULTISPECIES: alternate-type signal peptide domain-containing protein [Microbacterium]|nr:MULTISPECIES: alternate-type signal peptide domain-containing protein [Microbacterium]MBD3758181.1 alternate-type signal peptide domain-containing protein [Microbacterium sp.]MBM7829276.1 alternate signal-mediated exported protein [Microbacterium aurum]
MTKGTIAAGAALMLLLGTGGTLAYWNDNASLAGQTITAGQLRVVQNGTATWQIQHQSGTVEAVANIGNARIVPGDKLIYTGAYNVTAEGQNLAFKVDLAAGAITGSTTAAADVALAGRLAAAATFSVNGGAATAPGTSVTVPKTGGNAVTTTPVTITATITWPFGDATSPAADNLAKQGKVNLSAFALTVTQVAG